MNIETVNTWVVVALGFGALLGGLWKGFSVLRRTLDNIERMTKKELTTNGSKPDPGHESMLDKINALQNQIGTVTADVSGVKDQVHGVRDDLTSQHRELTEHIADVKAKASKLSLDAEGTAAAWVKYVFEHRADHKELHQWLVSEFGVDRRSDSPEVPDRTVDRRDKGA